MAESLGTAVEIVFKRGTEEGADFELGFSALLTTTVLATIPGGEQALFLKIGAILLSAVTMFRWMAIKGRFADEMAVLWPSYRLIELLLVICLFHIIYTSIRVLPDSSDLNILMATSIGAILVTVALIVVFEVVLKNYRVWWGVVFLLRSVMGDQKIKETSSTLQLSVLYILIYI